MPLRRGSIDLNQTRLVREASGLSQLYNISQKMTQQQDGSAFGHWNVDGVFRVFDWLLRSMIYDG